MNPLNGSGNSDDNLAKLYELFGKKFGQFDLNVTVGPPSASFKDLRSGFAIAGVVLGAISVLLNSFVLLTLCLERRQAFKHVFYILLVTFAVTDFIKGCGLIVFGVVKIFETSSDDIIIVKIEQIIIVILRTCNLATILNVLTITSNEFIFIKWPFKYHRWVTKLRAVTICIFNWVASILYSVLMTLARSKAASFMMGPCTNDTATSTHVEVESQESGQCFFRSEEGKNMVKHNLKMFILIGFCLLCLLVVIVCYAIMFKMIQRIQQSDARLEADALQYRRTSHRHSSEFDFSNCSEPDEHDTRVKRQLLRRYKYVIVIGSVILVYMVYLIPYTIIQVLQYARLRQRGKQLSFHERRTSFIIQWLMQICVGLHAVLQPLCYCRMKEFRQFVWRGLCRKCICWKDGAAAYTDAYESFVVTENGGIRRVVTMSNTNGETKLLKPKRSVGSQRGSASSGTGGRLSVHFTVDC